MTRKQPRAKTRDELLTMVRYGRITPSEAEAEAAAQQWEPFAREPQPPKFDPMLESRWTMVMAVAWIAWRDIRRVRENCPGFRSESTLWVFEDWNERTDDGAYVPQSGWLLRSWRQATTVRLPKLESSLAARSELPATRRMTVANAETELWRALSDGHLTAEALDSNGKPLDIPQREWSYLKLFEEAMCDVLKYDALDREPAFTDVKLKRDDLVRLWPAVGAYETVDLTYSYDPVMIAPVTKAGGGGYVPFSSAVLWIMTAGGGKTVVLDDQDAWNAAVGELISVIHRGEIDLIGLPRGGGLPEKIPGHGLAQIKVLPPGCLSPDDIALDAPSHIDCTPFSSEADWSKEFNDRLYVRYEPSPMWTHLQVQRDVVLRIWPSLAPLLPAAQPEHALRDSTVLPKASPLTRAETARIAADTFREWRAQQPAGYVPTFEEDVAHMKRFGFVRKLVRGLRKEYPKRPRGLRGPARR